MYKGQTVFLQLTDHLPRRTFRRLVKHYNADHRVRSFTCWEQFLAMPSPSSPTGRACAPALGAYGGGARRLRARPRSPLRHAGEGVR
jgi:hypothetical protein